MEEITLCELINNDKYKSFVTPGDKKYFNEHGYLKEIGRNVKKIKRKYKYVEVIGTGKDVILKLDDKDPNAIVDRRSVSNTKELTIMLSNNFKNKYNGYMLGSRHKAKEWLMITGFRRPYENINELRQEIRESFGGNYYSDYDKRPVDINNYYEPPVEDLLFNNRALQVLNDEIEDFYAYAFGRMKNHLKNARFDKVLIGKDTDTGEVDELSEDETIEYNDFINMNKGKNNTSRKLIRSKKFRDFMFDKLEKSSIWVEYKLVEYNDNTSHNNNMYSKEEMNKAFSDYLIHSMINREVGGFHGVNDKATKIPYKYEKVVILSQQKELIQEFRDLGLINKSLMDITFTNSNDMIWYKIIKDRVLVKSIARIIEISTDYQVNLTEYNNLLGEWDKQFRNEFVQDEDNKALLDDLDEFNKYYNFPMYV